MTSGLDLFSAADVDIFEKPSDSGKWVFSESAAKDLCLALMNADSERRVIDLLTIGGLWNTEEYWRNYGDNENNFSTIGSQQSRPDAALVEKVVNCVDHRLINECLERGIDPKGKSAPQSIQAAVSAFFDDDSHTSYAVGGSIHDWGD